MTKKEDLVEIFTSSELEYEAILPPSELVHEDVEWNDKMIIKWEDYTYYIDKLILSLFIEAVNTNFSLLSQEMHNISSAPILELIGVLLESHIIFIPSISLDNPVNVWGLMHEILSEVQEMGYHITRVSNRVCDPTYFEDILLDKNLYYLYCDIMFMVSKAIDKVNDYEKGLAKYSYLWLEDRQEFLKQFLIYGRSLTMDEVDALRDVNSPKIKESPPSVDKFKEQIDSYEELYRIVDMTETEHIIDSWLRINITPLKHSILNTICKWTNMFKEYLVEHVINSLDKFETFITEAIGVMQEPLEENDYDGLLKVMGYLYKVKEMSFETDNMFPYLHQIIELLKSYDVEFSEEIIVQLQELPSKWNNCKTVSVYHT